MLNKSNSMAGAEIVEANLQVHLDHFYNFDLHKAGQGHRVRLSQWFHSIANIKTYKSQIWHLLQLSPFPRYHCFRDISNWHIWPCKSRSRLRSTTSAIAPFANIKLYKSDITHFCALAVSAILEIDIFDFNKSRSRPWITILAMAPFDGKYQNL